MADAARVAVASGAEAEPEVHAEAESEVAPAAAPASAEAPARQPKGSSKLPAGVRPYKDKLDKFQARLSWKGEGGGWRQRFIPGIFGSVEEAVEKLAAANEALSTTSATLNELRESAASNSGACGGGSHA